MSLIKLEKQIKQLHESALESEKNAPPTELITNPSPSSFSSSQASIPQAHPVPANQDQLSKIKESLPKLRLILTGIFYFCFYMLPLSAKWFIKEEKLYTATNVEPWVLYPLNRWIFESATFEGKSYSFLWFTSQFIICSIFCKNVIAMVKEVHKALTTPAPKKS